MNRQEFYSRYREARKAIRFYGDMKDATGAMIATMFDTLDLCPRFDICRLHGDHLGRFGKHLGHVTNKSRMNYLRTRPRLPA